MTSARPTSLLLLAAALLIGEGARAQCGFLPASSSGDDNPRLAAYESAFPAIFFNWGADTDCQSGEQECYGKIGGNDFSSNDVPVRRLANALSLAYDQSFDATRSWGEWGDPVGVTEPHEGCDPYMETSVLTSWINVARGAHEGNQVWFRASALMHEARHTQQVHHYDFCSRAGKCDFRWNEVSPGLGLHGSYRRGVEFLADFVTADTVNWSSAARSNAAVHANRQLNRRFERHPGFNFYKTPSDALDTWKFADVDYEIRPADSDPESWTHAIRAVYLFISPTTNVPNNTTSPALRGMAVTFRVLGKPPPNEYTVSLGDTDAEFDENTIVIDAALAGPNHVLNVLGLKWFPTPIFGSDTTAQGSVGIYAVAVEVAESGLLENPSQLLIPGSIVVTPLELDVLALSRSHHVLTGLGLGTSIASQRFSDSTFSDALPTGPLTRFVGTGDHTFLVADVMRRECAADEVAVGVVAGRNEPSPVAPFVGWFGLLCRAKAEVASGALGFPSRLVHGSFGHPSVGQLEGGEMDVPSAVQTLSQLSDFGALMQVCAPGSALSGVALRAGALIDRIEAIRCMPLAPTAVPNDHTIGVGALGGEAIDLNCTPGRVASGMLESSNTVLNGLGLACVEP